MGIQRLELALRPCKDKEKRNDLELEITMKGKTEIISQMLLLAMIKSEEVRIAVLNAVIDYAEKKGLGEDAFHRAVTIVNQK
jgi:hypothetical protein